MRRPLGGSRETFWMLNIALLILVEFLTAFIDLLSDFVCKWWAPMWFWLWPQSPSLSSSLQSARPVSKIAAMPFRWRAWANMQAVRCRLYTTSCFSTMHGLNRSKQGVGTCGNGGQRELLLVEINAGEFWKSIVAKIKYGNDKPAKTWFDFAGIASTEAEGILKVDMFLQTLLKTLHLTSFKDVAVKECRRFTSPVEASYSSAVSTQSISKYKSYYGPVRSKRLGQPSFCQRMAFWKPQKKGLKVVANWSFWCYRIWDTGGNLWDYWTLRLERRPSGSHLAGN